MERQAALLSRGSIIREVLDKHAYGFLVSSIQEGVDLVNAFAPEHLVLVTRDEDAVLDGIRTAGAIYAGAFSTVACGDFLAGPSHTLPTGGAGKSFSGLRADQFQRRTSVVRMNREGRARVRSVRGGVRQSGGAGRLTAIPSRSAPPALTDNSKLPHPP